MTRQAYDNRTLENKTQIYWGLSRIWNGRSEQQCSTEMAISITSNVVNFLSPHRPLARRFNQLGHAIVHGNIKEVDIPQRSA